MLLYFLGFGPLREGVRFLQLSLRDRAPRHRPRGAPPKPSTKVLGPDEDRMVPVYTAYWAHAVGVSLVHLFLHVLLLLLVGGQGLSASGARLGMGSSASVLFGCFMWVLFYGSMR
jgi:hypothetical protein